MQLPKPNQLNILMNIYISSSKSPKLRHQFLIPSKLPNATLLNFHGFNIPLPWNQQPKIHRQFRKITLQISNSNKDHGRNACIHVQCQL